ncbi:TetR/AcrR family transcriptional regulator [Paenibacillus sp. CMAA1364]
MSVVGKERILQAAQRVIIAQGINGATMRSIAQEAGLSTGAIYHYYKNKEDVLYDVMDHSLSESTRIAEKSRTLPKDNDILIAEITDNILKRFKKPSENKLHFYLAQEAMIGNEDLRLKFTEKYDEWITRSEELIKLLHNKEESKHSRAFVSLLIGAIDGVALQMVLGSNVSTPEEVTTVYHYILKEGIPRFMDFMNSQTLD